MGILDEQTGLAEQTAELGYDIAQSEFTAGQKNIGMGANMALRRTQAFGNQAYSQSNLATSGTIESNIQMQTGDLWGKYRSDQQKITESLQFAGKEKDLQLARADITEREKQGIIEDSYQGTLTGLESIPTTVGESLFG